MRALTTTISILLIFISCTTSRNIGTDVSTQQISFGKGGGFVGSVTTYTLSEDGQLFRTAPIEGEADEMHPVPKIKRKTCKQIFNQAEALSESSMEFDHPGNMYYFIEIKNGKKTKRFTWGDPEKEVPENIKNFYNLLYDIQKPQDE